MRSFDSSVRSAVALASLCVVGLAGCSQQQIDKTQSAIASAAPALANDAAIYTAIEGKFASIDADSALHVAVASHEGYVRLTGRVKSDAIEKKFVDAATQTSGVKHVGTALTVDAKLPSATKVAGDFALAAVVRGAVTAQAGVNGIGLGIAAKSGVVTLSGNVPSGALHQTILATVRKTAGVTSVVDHLHDQS
jgi:osmotically-inducible protein OsmY